MEPPSGSVSAREGVTYRARQLHPDVRAVQRGVAALPRPPLSRVGPFLVLPAPHGEREQVPAGPPPVPRVVAVSILLLGGEGWAWERLPAVRTSTPQLRMWRVANPGGGAQVPEGRKQEGPGRPGGRERRGGAAGTQTAPPKCPASRAECWATMGGPGPCPQWRPASSPLGEPEALRGQATAPGRPHSAPRGVQSARAHRSTWEQQAWGLARTQGVCHA